MLIRIDGKVYEANRIADISLKDLLLFNTQAEMLGTHYRWADVERLFVEFEELDSEALARHPDKWLLPAVLVWMARRTAGDNVTFEEALEVPFSSVERMAEPKDRAPSKGKGKGGRNRKRKHPHRPKVSAAASGVAADLAALEALEASTPSISGPKSPNES